MYICPEPSCDETKPKPAEILGHIRRKHKHLAPQLAQCWRIVLDKATETPGYMQSSSDPGGNRQTEEGLIKPPGSKRPRQAPDRFVPEADQSNKQQQQQQQQLDASTGFAGVLDKFADAYKIMSDEKDANAKQVLTAEREKDAAAIDLLETKLGAERQVHAAKDREHAAEIAKEKAEKQAQNQVHAAQLAKEKAEAREQIALAELKAEKSMLSFVLDVVPTIKPAASSTARKDDVEDAEQQAAEV